MEKNIRYKNQAGVVAYSWVSDCGNMGSWGTEGADSFWLKAPNLDDFWVVDTHLQRSVNHLTD